MRAGEQTDAITGCSVLRDRWYAPGNCRFTSRDAVSPNAGGTQGSNHYWFANSNPTTNTDPSGHAASARLEVSWNVDVDEGLVFNSGRDFLRAFTSVLVLGGTAQAAGGATVTVGSVATGAMAVLRVMAALLSIITWHLVIILLVVVLAVVAVDLWCQSKGVPFRECMRGGAARVREFFPDRGLTSIIAGVATTAVATCAALLNPIGPLSPQEVAASCQRPPDAEVRCAAAGIGAGLGELLYEAAVGGPAVDPITLLAAVDEGADGYRECKEGKRTPDCSRFNGDESAKGGVYVLRDRVTGKVMRTGRTNDFDRRQFEHGQTRDTRDLDFEPVFRTNDADARRGLEQILHEANPEASLNKIGGIDPRNPDRQTYLDAALDYLSCTGKSL